MSDNEPSTQPLQDLSLHDEEATIVDQPPPQPKKSNKVRKGQTDEEYEVQKKIFHEHGPLVNSENWLLDEESLANLDRDNKYHRTRIVFACEKLYFEKKYAECLNMIKFGEDFYNVQEQDIPEVSNKTKKSSKVDRQAMDLMHIKKKCLAKLGRD